MASARRFCALVRDASAERTWALAAASCASVALALSSTVVCWALAADTLACARATASFRSRSSTDASGAPLATLSPTFTSTAVTVPGTLNVALLWSTGEIVPDRATVNVWLERATVTSS